MVNKIKIVIGCILGSVILFHCNKEDWYTIDFENNMEFPTLLSELELFENMANLTPASDVHVYEMGATLFTDHAEKQRLIKLPLDSKMIKQNNGLPDFPDGAILAKTFYYYNNTQQPEQGQNIIETRILLKNEGIWNIATYLWNESQTDATYIENGYQTPISWIDETGNMQSIDYSVPRAMDCATCHQLNEVILPIGPKLRNLNIDITVDNSLKNQLAHFQDINLLSSFELNEIINAPSYNDVNRTIEERGRAYLDINCAHCHTNGGIVDDEGYDFDYNTPLLSTGILWDKEEILEQFSSGEMPYIGTSTIDANGLDILTKFIEEL